MERREVLVRTTSVKACGAEPVARAGSRDVAGSRAGANRAARRRLRWPAPRLRRRSCAAAAWRRSGSCRTDWRRPGPRCPAPSRESARRAPGRRRRARPRAASPIEPASIDASSVRMSPNMFSVTITSKSAGRLKRCIAAASTSRCSTASSGNSSRNTRVATSRHSRDVSSTLALSTDVTLRRRPIASLPATRQTRSISAARVLAGVERRVGRARLRLPK